MKEIFYFLIFIRSANRLIVSAFKQGDRNVYYVEDMLSGKKETISDYIRIDVHSYERLKERMSDYPLDFSKEMILRDLKLEEYVI